MYQPVLNQVESNSDRLVVVKDVNQQIAISPTGKKYQLAQLLDGVTPELIGGEYNWGKLVGKEVW
jgi:antitoxin component of MazEF toxin-antitoxin module